MKKINYKLLMAFTAILFATLQGEAQRITTIVGNGTSGFSGDGGQATAAEISLPGELTLDAAGNLYLCDAGNNRIRKVSTSGVISTIAGNGTAGFSGDGGQATAAEISGPAAVLVDASGNIYIVDAGNNRVRKINTSGVISTIIGNGTAGFSGDGGQATAAELSNPQDVVFDASGNLYLSDFANHRIRKVNTSGVISTICGNGTGAYSGDGGQATAAEISGPSAIEFDASGNLYIADRTNNRIRMINTSGVISTICGNGTAGFTGDGGQATVAELSSPTDVDFDAAGNLYITDRNNNRIRKIYASGVIATVAGNGTAGYSGDGGAATAAEFSGPAGIVDNMGNLYIGDRANNRIRKITYSQTFYFQTTSSGNFSDATIWQASQDGSTNWAPVLNPPNYRSSGIVITTGDSVIFNSTDTLDQLTVNGVLNYDPGCTLKLNNGTGVDMAIASGGKFYDNGDNAIVWNSATWTLAGGAYLIRTRSTSSDNFRDQYDLGISTIPATSYWIVRKTGSDNPTLSSLSSIQYGNLYIENTTGTTWITPSGSSFTGSSSYPIIKGNMSIGGNSSGNVSFLDTNTNAATTLVQGNFTINSGSIFRNHGTGFEVQGNVTLNGVDSTSSTSVIKLSGSNTQTLSGSNLSFKNLRIHKTSMAATVSLVAACNIRGSLKLDTGVIVSDTVHLLTFNAGSTTVGVNDSSFVSGPVKKIGNTAFTFPLGKDNNSQTIAISAPSNTTDAFQAEYFDVNPTTTYGVYTDTTFNYISTCEYFILKRKNGTSNIQPTLSYDPTACISNLLPSPRVIGYNGAKWKDLGITNLTYSPTGGTVSSASVITTYGAITLGNYNPLIINTPNGDTCFSAYVMPNGATSTLTGQTQSTSRKWYTFTPTTPELKITLTNTSMGSNHIHDLVLLEGLCYDYLSVGYDSSRADTTLTIKLHEALVGAPYFISTFRERTNCYMCTSSANFDLTVQCLPVPVQTVTNSIVSLNGNPSHKAEEVIIRIDKNHLNMTNVNNTSLKSGIASQFFGSDITSSIATLLYNNDTATVNNLQVRKIYPNLTSNDTMRLSIDSQSVRIPAFYENFVLSLPKNNKLFNTSRQLTALQWVKYAEPNFVAIPSSVPNDSYYASMQESLHPTATYPDGSIHAEGAWDIETGQSFINVGVYDSGIDGTHVELNGSKIGGGYDCIGGTSILSGTNNDLTGHGTGCAGIIGGYRNNSTGIAGIAGGDGTNPGCTLYDMRILGGAVSTSDIAQSIVDGVDIYGLHIMNNSWSSGSSNFDIQLHDAVQYAAKNGVIFCASRGNYAIDPLTGLGVAGTNINDYIWPACFQDEMVINVGASGTDGAQKNQYNGDFSNSIDQNFMSMIAKNVDVLAPGTTAIVYTTKPNSSSYQAFDGTSAACPHVAGLAALMLSYLDQPTNSPDNLVVEDVEQILQRTAYNVDFPGTYDSTNGWGLINATNAMNAIKQGTYKIHHFALNQNTTSGTHLWTPYRITNGAQVHLTEAYETLDAGDYTADRYAQNVELHYVLPAGETIVAAWPRFSSTVGWAYDSPISTDNWCSIQSISSSECILQTYFFDFYNDQNGNNIDPTYPANPTAGVTIYTRVGTAGIDKINADNSVMNLYPNPAYNNTTISVTLSNDQEISLEIYDMQGRLVKNIAKERVSEGSHQYAVSLSNMISGVYYVRLITDTYTSERKLVVTK